MKTTYLWPRWLVPSEMSWTFEANERTHESPISRVMRTVELGNGRWRVLMSFDPDRRHRVAAVEAMIARLDGRTNTVALWDMREERAVPRGTMRGAPALSVQHTKGAQVLSVQTTPGATLLAGDRIGVVSQVFQVDADAVADLNGVMAVRVHPRTWATLPMGAVVTWSEPVTRFRLAGATPVLTTRPGYADGWTIELVQDIDPAVISAVPLSPARAAGDNGFVNWQAATPVNLNIVGNQVVFG